MRSLRSIQQRLAAEILGVVGASPPADDGFRERLRLPAGIDADSRLAIYRDGYPSRILDALRDAYPAMANICGEGSFAALAWRYLSARDQSRTALNDVGRELPGYCSDDHLGRDLPFLADLAKLEWSVLTAFHSRDLEPVDPARFAAWDMDDWDRAVLSFQPSAAIVTSAWPIGDLWDSRETPRDQIDIDLADRPQTVLVRRGGFDVHCSMLDADAAVVLGALMGGAPLGTAMDSLAESGESDNDLSAMFASWLGAGLITAVELAPRA